MTPAEVEALDDVTYTVFVRFMEHEANQIRKAAKAKR